MSSHTNFTVPGCVRRGWKMLHPGWRASEGHPPILYTSTAPGINMFQEGDLIQRPLMRFLYLKENKRSHFVYLHALCTGGQGRT
jgi:hypothetical protein